MRVGDDFRIRFNSKLHELLNNIDVVKRINIKRLGWLSHVVRMVDDAPARRVFDAGKSPKRTALYPLEGPNRGSLVIVWCDQMVGAQKAVAPERRYCGRPKAVNRVIMVN